MPERRDQSSKRARKSKVRDDPCRHPIGRRIGTACAVCGAPVASRRKSSA